MESLLKNENFSSVIHRFNELNNKVEDAILKIENDLSEEFKPNSLNSVKKKYKSLLDDFKKLEETNEEEIENDIQINLLEKRSIIEGLKQLVEREKEAGPAFSELNALKERWHNSGHVQSSDEKELQNEYNVLIDEFYYNAKIYKELKIYSLRKNLDLKNEVIQKIESLHNVKSIKQVEFLIRAYQKEWSQIGPTSQEEWPNVRNKYYDAINKVYDVMHQHYDEVKQFHQETYDEKKKIINEVAEINNLNIRKFRDWQRNTDKVIGLQDKWKKTGFLNRKQNEECWNDFKSECDKFFENKKQFFEDIKRVQLDNRDAKKELLKEADSIKDSRDWKNTTDHFINLQNQWKEIGAANRTDEQKLWKKFKSICDHFFNAKRDFFAHLDEFKIENLKLKEDLIKEIENYLLTGNRDKSLEAVKEFTIKWKSIDQVPTDSINKVNHAFNKAINQIYSSLNIDKEQKDLLKFKHKIDSWKESDERATLFRKEKALLRDKISKAESDLFGLEDKMSFFKNTNHENPLRDELIKKIETQQKHLSELKEKYNLIRNN